MSLTFPKRSFTGAGVAGTLDAPGISSIYTAGDTFKSSTTLTGWDDVTGGVWAGSVVVAFGVGTAGEEKILCNFTQSTSTFTIVTRGYDGTSSAATSTWSTGSLFTVSFTATEAAELNAVTQSMKTILTNAGTTTTPQPITVGSSAGSIGTGTKPSAIDHDHKISVSSLNSWLSGSASGAMNSAVTVYLASLAAGALPTAVTTSRIWSANGTGATGASITGVSGYNNYIMVAAHTYTSGTTAGENSANITANSQTPTAAIAYVRSTGTSGNHASSISFTTGAACGVTTTAAFNVSVVSNQVTGTSNAHTLFVIGLN